MNKPDLHVEVLSLLSYFVTVTYLLTYLPLFSDALLQNILC